MNDYTAEIMGGSVPEAVRAAVAAERARCAALCREVACFYHQEDIGSVVARACADEIERDL